MKQSLPHRLREHVLDVRDWIDIRPDPSWWPLLAIAAVVGIASYILSPGIAGLLAVGAVVLTILILVTLALGTGLLVLVRTFAVGSARMGAKG